MGTAFFQGQQNSTGGRAIVNDPIHSFIFGRPAQVNATAGPYAGVAPSLGMAQRGYALTPSGQPGGGMTPGNSAQLAATFGGGK